MDISEYKYAPILSLKSAEMAALEELPEKDKNLILPLIPLKGWVGSKRLESSIERIKKSIGNRLCITDIDKFFLSDSKDEVTGKYPDREVFKQLDELQDSSRGYEKWVEFIRDNDNFVPVLQLDELSEFGAQVENFLNLKRFFVVRISLEEGKRISSEELNLVVRELLRKKVHRTFFIFDCGDIGRKELLERHRYAELIKSIYSFFPEAFFSISGTSFPYSFAGSYKGELPIYERQIYDYVERKHSHIKMIYSDRGSARAGNMGGGNGAVPVRLDYPLKHDWRFIRKEPDVSKEKDELYQEAAIEMMESEYWQQAVPVWGTQMIERTSLRDPFAITSPNRATAARINIHLFQQLHYHDNFDEIDTEEDWED